MAGMTSLNNTIILRGHARGSQRKEVMLIMDQAGWHCATHLMTPDNIIIELLPPYSPERNPTEKLWQWLRMHVYRN